MALFSFLNKKKKETRPTELGMNPKKHIRCEYKNKNKCPDDCEKCHFTFQTQGDFMLKVEAYDSAIEMYCRSLEIEPDNADALCSLGDAYTAQGHHELALKAYEAAIDVDAIFGKALFGRATALKNLGQLEEALDVVEDLLSIYDYEPCRELRNEINRLEAMIQEEEAKKLEEKNRLVIKMMKRAAELGYIKDRMATVPEITDASEVFIPECFLLLTGHERFSIEAVKAAAACCFFGGMGVAGMWMHRMDDFSLEGLREGLIEPKGFACIDEYACELIGVDPQSTYAEDLRKFAKDCSRICMNVIMQQVGAVKMDDMQMADLVKYALRDVFMVGAGIALERVR